MAGDSEKNESVRDGTAHPERDNSNGGRVGGAAISEETPVFSHLPVMLSECIDGLRVKPDGVYVDGTAGGGGHSSAIAERLTTGRLIAIDRDIEAIEACRARLSRFGERVTLVHDNYRNMQSILTEAGVAAGTVDGVLLDLGVSSHQIDTVERGFSYSTSEDAPLDMRMSREDSLTAFDVVNGYSADELRRIIYEYGEERFAGRIAERIVRERENAPIKTTRQLSELIKSAVPQQRDPKDRGSHPAKRTFQAIRIEVNGELDGIEPALRAAVDSLGKGGRLAVITFHSLEDRIVKNVFSELAKGCICPPDFPVCVCGRSPSVRLVNKKPTVSSADELARNPRAKSAKLRVVEKI